MSHQLEEIHPGEILLEEFMKPLGITARQLSADIDVPPSRISELVNGLRPVTPDTALRLGLFFKMEARFWINLQTEYDMRVATRTLLSTMQARVRVFQANEPSTTSPTQRSTKRRGQPAGSPLTSRSSKRKPATGTGMQSKKSGQRGQVG